MTAEPRWPPIPDSGAKGDYEKVLFQAKVDLAKAAHQQDDQQQQKDSDAELELFKGFHTSVRATAQTLAGAKQSNAELVQKAAATVITIYTGVLGVVFAVSSHPLPLRGLVPAIFVGLSVALSTAYVAYVDKRSRDVPVAVGGSDRDSALAYTNTFVDWINARVDARAAFIRAAVWALACGLLLLPAPFVEIGERATSAVVLPDWPTYSPTPTDGEAGKVLYQAQVTETAARRDAAFKASLQSRPKTVALLGRDLEVAEVGAWSLAAIFGVVIAVASTWDSLLGSARRLEEFFRRRRRLRRIRPHPQS